MIARPPSSVVSVSPSWVADSDPADEAAAPAFFFDLTSRHAWLGGAYYQTEAGIKGLFSTFSTPAHYATGTDGLLYLVPANRLDDFVLPAGVAQGLLVEMARTNVALWSNDLTNAAWAKTTATAALDQTGPDGVVNSASSITATAPAATALQSIVLASSARYQTAYVKRLTGSGAVSMTMDGGTTFTPVTVTGSWTRVSTPTQTLANPVVGFRLAESGDAIAVWGIQNENGTFATSPIVTTAAPVARAAALINRTLTGAEFAANSGSIFATVAAPPPVTGTAVSFSSGTPQNRLELDSRAPGEGALTVVAQTVVLTSNPLGSAGSGERREGVTYTVGSLPRGTNNGGTVAAIGSNAYVAPTLTRMSLGFRDVFQDQYINGYVKRVAIYKSPFDDARLSAITA